MHFQVSQVHMLDDEVFTKWFEREQVFERQRKRQYDHFDPRIRVTSRVEEFRHLFGNPKEVAQHWFYPFIKNDIVTPRYKKTGARDEQGKPVREKKEKRRPIAYAAHYDAVIYSWYSTLLSKHYERCIEELGIAECVLAYIERDKSNINYAHEAFSFIRTKGECVAIALDLSSFFDTLDHRILKQTWAEVLGVQELPADHYSIYKQVTRYSLVEKEKLAEVLPRYRASIKAKHRRERICTPAEFRTLVVGKGLVQPNPFQNEIPGSARLGKTCGIPQGSPLSATLSNLYMLHFDERMHGLLSSIGGTYRRYCDDILLVCGAEDLKMVNEAVYETASAHELIINKDKTEEHEFKRNRNGRLECFAMEDGRSTKLRKLQYLGFEFDGDRVYIRSASMSRYFSRLKSRIRRDLRAGYGKNAIRGQTFKRKLFNRYTDKGKRNFITYAKRAARIMDSPEIAAQVKDSIKRVKTLFAEMEAQYLQKQARRSAKGNL